MSPSTSRETAGIPDLSRGIDKTRMQDPAYQEKLSSRTNKLSAVSSEISAKLASSPDLVNIGVMPGMQTLVIYWSGARDSSQLSTAMKIAENKGVLTLIAPRKVSKSELNRAQTEVEKNIGRYKERGVYLGAYGGFAADFDGIKVTVDEKKSTLKDLNAIRAMIETDAGVPIQVSLGNIAPLVGRVYPTNNS